MAFSTGDPVDRDLITLDNMGDYSMSQKSMADIIKEFVDIYVADPSKRGLDSRHMCVYLNPMNGNQCMVGRCLVDPKGVPNSNQLCDWSEIDQALFDDLLKPEYRGHDFEFWIDMQDLHDLPTNWKPTGLSAVGEEQLRIFRDTWLSVA